jgi:hypothetical protein
MHTALDIAVIYFPNKIRTVHEHMYPYSRKKRRVFQCVAFGEKNGFRTLSTTGPGRNSSSMCPGMAGMAPKRGRPPPAQTYFLTYYW